MNIPSLWGGESPAPALAVLSVDRRAIAFDRRAAFTAAAEVVRASLSEAALSAGEEVVVLDTCERFEVYHASNAVTVPRLLERLDAHLLAHRREVAAGVATVRHLFRVASGLESRLWGEPHVLGQVRAALECARLQGTAHRPMVDAFSHAIRCGRRVRNEAGIGSERVGYGDRAAEYVLTALAGTARGRVAVVGTGALAREVARALRHDGDAELTIIGRHEDHVIATSRAVGARALGLHSARLAFPPCDAVVTAVGSADPVITAEMARASGAKLFVDLGVAPNVDRLVDALPGVRVLRLDDLRGGDPAADNMARAESVLEREVERYALVVDRTSGPSGWWKHRRAS